MDRLTRAEAQERNRRRVLVAAREEFTEHGFREAKVDRIAERAGLTRGAVYSNYPGKRALYFAVLADHAENSAPPPHPGAGTTAREALGMFARAWVTRLPLVADDQQSPARLGQDLMPEIASDERIRQAYAQLMRLNAVLLGLAVERLGGGRAAPSHRQVPVAEAVLTTLYGASVLAATAPGFVEPFDTITACERLAGLELDGGWPPAHLPWLPPARPVEERWSPPRPAGVDAVRREAVAFSNDGVVAVLGLHRLEAAEEAVRAAPPGAEVTAVLVTGEPGELGPLARLAVADLCGCLRQAFPRSAWPLLRVVHDERGTLAAAAGVPAVSDETETAVRVTGGRITARAEGRGACHAAASAG